MSAGWKCVSWVVQKVKLLSRVRLFVTPWTVSHQAPLSMEFFRQEYWSVLPLPSPLDLPDPGIKPGSPALQADTLPSEPPWKPHTSMWYMGGAANNNEHILVWSKSFKSWNSSTILWYFSQFSSVAQSCPTLCDPTDCSMPGLPVHHQHPEFTQTHVHWVSDVIQPSHLLLSPSPPTSNLSQHQGVFWWVSYLHQVGKVLEFQLQHQSFQWIFRTDFLHKGLVGSPCSPRVLALSRVFTNISVLQYLKTLISPNWATHLHPWMSSEQEM